VARAWPSSSSAAALAKKMKQQEALQRTATRRCPPASSSSCDASAAAVATPLPPLRPISRASFFLPRRFSSLEKTKKEMRSSSATSKHQKSSLERRREPLDGVESDRKDLWCEGCQGEAHHLLRPAHARGCTERSRRPRRTEASRETAAVDPAARRAWKTKKEQQAFAGSAAVDFLLLLLLRTERVEVFHHRHRARRWSSTQRASSPRHPRHLLPAHHTAEKRKKMRRRVHQYSVDSVSLRLLLELLPQSPRIDRSSRQAQNDRSGARRPVAHRFHSPSVQRRVPHRCRHFPCSTRRRPRRRCRSAAVVLWDPERATSRCREQTEGPTGDRRIVSRGHCRSGCSGGTSTAVRSSWSSWWNGTSSARLGLPRAAHADLLHHLPLARRCCSRPSSTLAGRSRNLFGRQETTTTSAETVRPVPQRSGSQDRSVERRELQERDTSPLGFG
jgi:hypothetical protein